MALNATVTPGIVVVDGQTPINAATLNALARPLVAVSGTVGGSTSVSVDNLTIDQLGAGSSLQVKDLGISAGKIAANAVETAKILDANVTAAKLASEAVEAAKLDEGALSRFYGAGTYNAGTYEVDLTPNATAFTAGMVIVFKATAANAAGACNVKLDALASKPLKRGGKDPLANSIPANGWVAIVYDGTTNFEIIGQAAVAYESAELSLASGTNVLTDGANPYVAHGLGAAPRKVWGILRCTDAGGNAGYAQNDEIAADQVLYGAESPDSFMRQNITVWSNATQIGVLVKSVTSGPTTWVWVQSKATGDFVVLTASKWRLVVRAEL